MMKATAQQSLAKESVGAIIGDVIDTVIEAEAGYVYE